MGSHGIVHENESVVLTEVELERELTYNLSIMIGICIMTTCSYHMRNGMG